MFSFCLFWPIMIPISHLKYAQHKKHIHFQQLSHLHLPPTCAVGLVSCSANIAITTESSGREWTNRVGQSSRKRYFFSALCNDQCPWDEVLKRPIFVTLMVPRSEFKMYPLQQISPQGTFGGYIENHQMSTLYKVKCVNDFCCIL